MFGFLKNLFGSSPRMFDWLDRLGFSKEEDDYLPLKLSCDAWHETGHLIGTFLVKCTPAHVRINTNNWNAFVCNQKRFLKLPKGKKEIIHIGGWALERKFYDINTCKRSIGFGTTKRKGKSCDWHKLGRPSVERMDTISVLFYDKAVLEFAQKAHDELVEKRRLARKDILRLYGEFMEDERIRSIVCIMEKEFDKHYREHPENDRP
jgi:hypothetical protein